MKSKPAESGGMVTGVQNRFSLDFQHQGKETFAHDSHKIVQKPEKPEAQLSDSLSDPAQEFEQDFEEKLEESKVVDVSILESLEGLKDQNQGGERKFTPENKAVLEPQLL